MLFWFIKFLFANLSLITIIKRAGKQAKISISEL